MNKLHAPLLAACLLAVTGAHAADPKQEATAMQDPKARDDMAMKKDAMGKDDMKTKKDAMGMKRDSMAKKPGMKKDSAM